MNLTPKQRMVARHYLRGWSSVRIARELGIAVDTVGTHRAGILTATGQDQMLTAILWILRNPEALAYVMECPLEVQVDICIAALYKSVSDVS